MRAAGLRRCRGFRRLRYRLCRRGGQILRVGRFGLAENHAFAVFAREDRQHGAAWHLHIERAAAEAGGEPHRLALQRSEEHTSELQSLMRIPYAVFCLKKKKHSLHTETYIQMYT